MYPPGRGSPAVIDDPPTPRLLALHQPSRILGTEDRGGDVDVHEGEEFLDGQVFDGDLGEGDSGVLYEVQEVEVEGKVAGGLENGGLC